MVMKAVLLVMAVFMAVCAALILYLAWTAPLMDDNYDKDDAGQK